MAEVIVHNMPSVFVMETEMPISMVNDPNDYLDEYKDCLLYTSPSPRDGLLSRMPSSA